MEKIKAAILVWNITNKAGTERAVCNLANLLAESSAYTPVIVSINSGENSQTAYKLQQGIKIIHFDLSIDFARKGKKIHKYFKLLKKLSLLCKKEEIDIVMGTTYTLNIILVLLNNKIKK